MYQQEFTREIIFEAASQGNPARLNGLLDYLRATDKKLTSPEFTGKSESFMCSIKPHSLVVYFKKVRRVKGRST